MPTHNEQRLPLREVWRLITGQEPPVLTEEEKAVMRAKRAAAREQARIFYGHDPDDRGESVE